jgi:hypothetical protein
MWAEFGNKAQMSVFTEFGMKKSLTLKKEAKDEKQAFDNYYRCDRRIGDCFHGAISGHDPDWLDGGYARYRRDFL